MRKNLLPIDELNALTSSLRSKDLKRDKRQIRDEIFEFLLDSYLLGITSASSDLNYDGSYGDLYKKQIDVADETINRRIGGKNVADRINIYCEEDDIESLVRVVDTEMHRDFNEAVFNTGKRLGAKTKTWLTMEDDKVRDPHWVLDRVTVGIDEKFYTDGYGARFPGDFDVPELNCNCRCYLEVQKE